MSYHGDIRLGDTIDIKFTTVDSTGAPAALTSGAVAAYVGNSTTEITAGITLSANFDSRTGLNNVRVVASSGNGYSSATNIFLVLTAGTSGGTSVVGYEIGSFSIENRSAVMPTTAARTLDISSGGAAGIDLANVEGQSTTLNLSGTTVNAVTTVNGLANNVITANSIASGAITSAKFAANALDAVWSASSRTLTSFGTLIADIWSTLTSGLTTIGSIGKLLTDNVDATISSRATQTSVDDVQSSLDDIASGTTEVTVGTNNDKTGYAIGTGGIDSSSFASGAIDASALAASAGQEIADELLNRDIQGGSSGSSRNVTNALRPIRNKVDGSSGTLVVYEEDDTTPAWTATLTRNTVDPIVTVG